MKRVLYTQRVEVIEQYNERRDCADQNIPMFLQACGYLPIPVSNVPELVEEFVVNIKPAGIVMTGGNSFVKFGGNAPEKDQTDRLIIEIAIRENIPIYGFCRGMQSILDYFNMKIDNVKGHVGIKHHINGEIEGYVNSYHNQAAFMADDIFVVLARSDDGVVEAISHRDKKIIATMWHPERENPFDKKDIERVQKLFG